MWTWLSASIRWTINSTRQEHIGVSALSFITWVWKKDNSHGKSIMLQASSDRHIAKDEDLHGHVDKKISIASHRGGATLPLGGAVAPAKIIKKSPPTYRQILIGPPNVEHPARSPISIRYFNSFPNSSFKCRPFYSLIKQNMAYSPLIFKYPKHYPTKQHFITHSPTQNQKI